MVFRISAALIGCAQVKAAEQEGSVSVPLTPVKTVLESSQLAPGQEVKVAGTVTMSLYSGSALFLQDETGAIAASGKPDSDIHRGARVEALGVIDQTGYSRTLKNCRFRLLGRGAAVLPHGATGAELKSGALDMHLVRVQGRVLRDPIQRADAEVVEIRVDQAFVTVLAPGARATALSQLRPGSLLELTGACSIGPDKEGRPAWVRIYVHPGDVVVLRGPPWWTPERTSFVLGLVAAIAVAAAGWMAMLRHQSHSRVLRRRVAEGTAELRERTAELERLNEELETFSYSVSHDLRAPLRAMSGFSNALLEDYEAALDGTARSYLHRISEAATHMSRLIDGLLALANVTRRELHRQSTDLSQIAEAVVEESRQGNPDRAVTVSIEPGMIDLVDADLVRIVFSNLVQNAWKFTRNVSEPRVEIGRLPGTPGPVYYVRDNGAGFDPARAGRLFQAFQRLHSPSEYEGTGIGLATVHKVVQRHGGRIWAEAKVNEGAAFYFILQNEAGPALTDTTRRDNKPGNAARVLARQGGLRQ